MLDLCSLKNERNVICCCLTGAGRRGTIDAFPRAANKRDHGGDFVACYLHRF